MDRIETITPVHVGTGEMIPAFCFQRVSNSKNYHRYNVSDIYAQIPSSILLNKSFLESLRLPKQGQSGKNDMIENVMKRINYNNLRPIYDIEFDDVSSLKEKNKDIDEQTKDLNGPYIPGSSIKGAILNAWKYYLLKELYEEDNVAYVLENIENLNDVTIVNLISGNIGNHSNFLATVQSCVHCEDIHFGKLEILQGKRIGCGERKKGNVSKSNDPLSNMKGTIDLEFAECIRKGQYSKGNVFTVDEKRKNYIRDNLREYVGDDISDGTIKCYAKILDHLTKENIVNACNLFTKAIIALETSQKYYDLYYISYFEEVNETMAKISNDLNMIDQKKEYYIRLGKHTNYFAKCISLLIKEESPNLYSDLFEEVFSPVGHSNRINAKSMPKTRSVYFNEYDNVSEGYVDTNDSYLLGFIKVTYD